MSAESWKKEFYPCEPDPQMTPEAAIKHSLQKWLGLRTASLLNHGIGKAPIAVCSSTCALCVKYLDRGCEDPAGDTLDADDDSHDCDLCPLYAALDDRKCDHEEEVDACTGEILVKAPYHVYTENDDPEPMIAALQKALEQQYVKDGSQAEIEKP